MTEDHQHQKRQLRGGRGGKENKAKGLQQKSLRQAQDLNLTLHYHQRHAMPLMIAR